MYFSITIDYSRYPGMALHLYQGFPGFLLTSYFSHTLISSPDWALASPSTTLGGGREAEAQKARMAFARTQCSEAAAAVPGIHCRERSHRLVFVYTVLH